MKLIATFNISKNLEKVNQRWQKALNKSMVGTRTRSNFPVGGEVSIIDLDSKKLEIIEEIPEATGFEQIGSQLLVASIGDNCIYQGKIRNIKQNKITNPIFNDLHSITKTSKGLLVSSTGLDALVEIDLSGNTIWSYFFTEVPGYKIKPDGHERVLKLKKDTKGNLIPQTKTSKPFPTLSQTTHVNSAMIPKSLNTDGEERYLLVTLYHQGKLILLDRKTGEIRTILDGLSCPHNIREYEDFFLISDSRANRTLILDKSDLINNYRGKVIKEIKQNFNWVQDSIFYENKFFIADSNNHCVVITDEIGEQIDVVKYSKELSIHRMDMFKTD